MYSVFSWLNSSKASFNSLRIAASWAVPVARHGAWSWVGGGYAGGAGVKGVVDGACAGAVVAGAVAAVAVGVVCDAEPSGTAGLALIAAGEELITFAEGGAGVGAVGGTGGTAVGAVGVSVAGGITCGGAVGGAVVGTDVGIACGVSTYGAVAAGAVTE